MSNFLQDASLNWIPTEYLDEVCPPGRASPDDWIVKLDDGCRLFPVAEEYAATQELKHGETMDFIACMEHGTAMLSWRSPKNWHISRNMPPQAMDCIYDNDSDSICYSIADMVEYLNSLDEPGDYKITFRSFPTVTMRFDAKGKCFHFVGEKP